MNDSNETQKGRVVSALTDEEKAALVKHIEATIKGYKIGFVFACISIVIIVGLVLAPAMYAAIRKQQKKLQEVQGSDLKVYEVKGTLTRKNIGWKGTLYAYSIDGFMIPGEVLQPNDKSKVQDHLNETVSFQYIPSISKYHSYTDSNGHGYNFITKTST